MNFEIEAVRRVRGGKRKGAITVKKLNYEEFDEVIDDKAETCLVFFSRQSCSVCKRVHPKLEALEAEYPNYSFYLVDVEEQPNRLVQFHLKGVPQTIFFVDGQMKRVITGNAETDDFIDFIEEYGIV